MRKILEARQFGNTQILKAETPYSIPDFLREDIENQWLILLAQAADSGRVLWNGPVYRLASDAIAPKSPQLELGTTDFKTYFGSGAINDKIAELPFADRPNGMFVSGFLETQDNKLVFGKKSVSSILPFDINFIGGTLSPDDEIIADCEGFAAALAREISEEVGLGADHIATIEPIGIWETKKHRIGVFMHALLNLSAHEFLEVSQPNDEHDHFLLFETNELKKTLSNGNEHANPMILATYPTFRKNRL